MIFRPVGRVFFYGHVQIALAAAGLGWLSVARVLGAERAGSADVWQPLVFLFLATLGVYTLHRFLSFRQAGAGPAGERYGLVRDFPRASLAVGGGALLMAGALLLPSLPHVWPWLLPAVPVTLFYLVPVLPGGRRLRDLPYVKVLWVGLAWALMTHFLPVAMLGGHPFNVTNWASEGIVRFLFTLTIAVIFDQRDVALDRRLGVRTIAGEFPLGYRVLIGVAAGLCFGLTWAVQPDAQPWLAVSYLLLIPIGEIARRRKEETFYAVVVNGMLLIPPLIWWIGAYYFRM